MDAIDWGDVAADDVSLTGGNPETSDRATGKDALSVIDNPETRNLFIDDLLEV